METLEKITFKSQFKSIVINHIHELLSDSEWKKFRLMGRLNSHPHLSMQLPPPQETPEALFDAYSSEDGISIGEVMRSLRISVQIAGIGTIDNRPVFYIENCGIYIWDIDGHSVLMFWCSFPAYPPGW